MNSSTAKVSLRPGSSLEIDVGGTYSSTSTMCPVMHLRLGSPALNSRTAYGPGVDLKWAFFPKTSIVASYTQTWFDWENNLVDTKGDGINIAEFGETLGVPDGSEWRATLGLRGRLTEKLVLGLIAGYGQMTYDETSVPATAGARPSASTGTSRVSLMACCHLRVGLPRYRGPRLHGWVSKGLPGCVLYELRGLPQCLPPLRRLVR